MSIKQTVQQALTMIAGKKVFTAQDVMNVVDFNIVGIGLHTDDNTFTIPQVSRALRDIPYVKRSNGRYVIKGRRVPPKSVAVPITGIEETKPITSREDFDTVMERMRKAA